MNTQPIIKLPEQSVQSTDAKIKDVLENAQKKLGFIPNMYTNMVNEPHMLEHYMFGYDKFRSESGFTPAEQEVVFLTISRENRCHYCVAAHSFLADNVSNVPVEVTNAIRDGVDVSDAKLGALSTFTKVMVHMKCWVKREDIDAFVAAGYAEKQVLDILLAISVKVISNYANHLFATPVDEIFSARVWEV